MFLALAFHNHQPVGNFDGTIEECFQTSYRPFLELISRPEYAGLKVSIHNSGCLEEWLDRHHPEYLDQLAALARSGQVEVLGGPFQEPILAMLPSRDRVGQILTHTRWLENRLGVRVRGMWMPERVWEQSYVGDLTRAGMEFTILDDFHFKKAGLPEEKLYGYYLTEDDGQTMAVYPDSEKLRYWIPFDSIDRSLNYLREIQARDPNAILFCGDDGEKFGAWPKTFDHVYGETQWLKHFFDVLAENSNWLRTVTFSEARDECRPLGKIYLPDCSYREMTEWAALEEIPEEETPQGAAQSSAPSAKPMGNWRNFKVKYPETNEMYCRALAVSRRLEALQNRFQQEARTLSEEEYCWKVQLLESARLELYRGQCNCPYWHGAFGGVYLPHLRNGIFRHLIEADRLLDRVAPNPEAGAFGDFNLDGEPEFRLESDELSAFFSPAAGGMMYELDVRKTGLNLLATLARRPEPYHRKIVEAVERKKKLEEKLAKAEAGELGEPGEASAAGTDADADDLGNIRDQVVFKQEGLEKRLLYDAVLRKSLQDGFYGPDVTPDSLYDGQVPATPSFAQIPYSASFRDGKLTLSAAGTARSFEGNTHTISVCKTVELAGNELKITWRLANLPRWQTILFGSEFNFAGLPGHCEDRYFYDAGGKLGDLSSRLTTKAATFLGLADEWQKLRVELEVSRITDFWTLPVETVSNSEGGYELVHQSVCVIPHWYIRAENDGEWVGEIRLRVKN